MLGQKMLVAAAIATLLSPAVLASGAPRTYYLLPSSAGTSDEVAGDDASLFPDPVIEEEGGSGFRAVLSAFDEPVAIDTFHLHLEDRELLIPAGEVTTRIRVLVQDPEGLTLLTPEGAPFELGGGTWTIQHPGRANYEVEGWTEFHFGAADLVVPAGHRLIVMVDLVGDEVAPRPFAALDQAVGDAAIALDEADLLPVQGLGPAPCPLVNTCAALRPEAIVIENLRSFSLLRSLDSTVDAFGTPRSTFAADDQGSWLRLT